MYILKFNELGDWIVCKPHAGFEMEVLTTVVGPPDVAPEANKYAHVRWGEVLPQFIVEVLKGEELPELDYLAQICGPPATTCQGPSQYHYNSYNPADYSYGGRFYNKCDERRCWHGAICCYIENLDVVECCTGLSLMAKRQARQLLALQNLIGETCRKVSERLGNGYSLRALAASSVLATGIPSFIGQHWCASVPQFIINNFFGTTGQNGKLSHVVHRAIAPILWAISDLIGGKGAIDMRGRAIRYERALAFQNFVGSSTVSFQRSFVNFRHEPHCSSAMIGRWHDITPDYKRMYYPIWLEALLKQILLVGLSLPTPFLGADLEVLGFIGQMKENSYGLAFTPEQGITISCPLRLVSGNKCLTEVDILEIFGEIAQNKVLPLIGKDFIPHAEEALKELAFIITKLKQQKIADLFGKLQWVTFLTLANQFMEKNGAEWNKMTEKQIARLRSFSLSFVSLDKEGIFDTLVADRMVDNPSAPRELLLEGDRENCSWFRAEVLNLARSASGGVSLEKTDWGEFQFSVPGGKVKQLLIVDPDLAREQKIAPFLDEASNLKEFIELVEEKKVPGLEVRDCIVSRFGTYQYQGTRASESSQNNAAFPNAMNEPQISDQAIYGG
jgi:hypothetical protein